MYFADLKTAPTLDLATDGALFPLLQDMLDDGLDPHVILERRPPSFLLLVIGLARGGDEIVVAREVPIDWCNIDERVKLGVLQMWVDQIIEKAERWKRAMNPKLVAVGVEPFA